MRLCLAALVSLALSHGTATRARAQSATELALSPQLAAPSAGPLTASAPIAEPPAQPRASWYGWQTIIPSALSLAVLAADLQTWDGSGPRRPWLSLSAIGVYVVSAPLIHWLHGQRWALPSLLLRAAAAGLAIGGVEMLVASDGHEHERGGLLAGGAIMFVVGALSMLALPALDAGFGLQRRTQDRALITPWVSPERNAYGLAWAGRL